MIPIAPATEQKFLFTQLIQSQIEYFVQVLISTLPAILQLDLLAQVVELWALHRLPQAVVLHPSEKKKIFYSKN